MSNSKGSTWRPIQTITIRKERSRCSRNQVQTSRSFSTSRSRTRKVSPPWPIPMSLSWSSSSTTAKRSWRSTIHLRCLTQPTRLSTSKTSTFSAKRKARTSHSHKTLLSWIRLIFSQMSLQARSRSCHGSSRTTIQVCCCQLLAILTGYLLLPSNDYFIFTYLIYISI